MISKQEARKYGKQIRKEMTKSDVTKISEQVCMKFIQSNLYKNSDTLMLYSPLGNETDTSYILRKAFYDGKKVVYPVTDVENVDIIPYYIDGDTVFCKGAFSIDEPENCIPADKGNIDTVIVPGVAFSGNGVRVGYGKGFYDRFLLETTAVKIGLCYDCQLIAGINAEEHDIMMDYIITENGVINCNENMNK